MKPRAQAPYPVPLCHEICERIVAPNWFRPTAGRRQTFCADYDRSRPHLLERPHLLDERRLATGHRTLRRHRGGEHAQPLIETQIPVCQGAVSTEPTTLICTRFRR